MGRLIKWFSIAFTAVTLIIMFTPVANRLAEPLVVRGVEPKKADIIVVLGGGAYRNGVLGNASRERVIKGMLLYREGYAPRIIFSGGTLLEPSKKIIHILMGTDEEASGVIEAKLMKEMATGLGIPEKDCAVDTGSLNTYENIRNVKSYMADNGLKTCLLVTSPTHMKRASLIARRLGLRFYPAPVTDSSAYRTGATDRLQLFRDVAWEYAGLLLYKVYGYI